MRSVFGLGAGSGGDLVRRKYASFRQLLATNNEILERIADLEAALAADQPIPKDDLLAVAESVRERALAIVDDLNVIADGRFRSLRGNVERIAAGIEETLRSVQGTPVTAACLPLEEIDRRMADVVGGKTANLGEVSNVLGLPVPPGFAITAFAYRSFVAGAGIKESLAELWRRIDWEDLGSVSVTAARMQALVLGAEIPQDVKESITLAAHDLYRVSAGHPRVSMRSSAIGEDSRTSFAGQYASFLNVPLEQILRRYRETVASKFGARALFYMHSRGFREDEIAMSVGCFRMIEARAAGVGYTVDPNDPDRDTMTVTAVWGLGTPVVGGTMTPDLYLVPRSPRAGTVERRIADKRRRVVCRRDEGTVEEDVPPELRGRPCLDDATLDRLASWMRALETHNRVPQDVEWVLDAEGRLFVLQTRPLALPDSPAPRLTRPPGVDRDRLLLSGGSTACPGAGTGPVVHAESDEELARFPAGGVLVARQNAPRFVEVMTRASAIVTDVGSVTGHMASLSREYGVPTLCNAGGATELPEGLEVTVDATGCAVYRGRVEELVSIRRPPRRSLRSLPSAAVQERVTARIAYLNLTDPSKNSFRAKNCATYHDVVRFCHEMAISEMFHINDYSNLREHGVAFRLETDIPLGIYVIDLGDGVAAPPGAHRITPEQIVSVPMRALWRGITTPGIRWAGARPIDVGGFLSALASTVADVARGERGLGDNSYAMVGARYVNFGSRLGYHFSTLEAVCGGSVQESYVVFRFKGGAAELSRRERRVRFIAEVLARYGFEVNRRSDLLNAWVKKLDTPAIEMRLEALGRLMGCVRQLDVAMHAETSVTQCVEAFLADRFELFDLEREGTPT